MPDFPEEFQASGIKSQ